MQNPYLPYALYTSQVGKVCQSIREIKATPKVKAYHSNIFTGLIEQFWSHLYRPRHPVVFSTVGLSKKEVQAVSYEGFSDT